MTIANRIVTLIPLIEVWKENTILQAKRNKYLTKEEIREMLKQGPVQFIVADVGLPLEWIQLNKCYAFRKKSVADNLSEKDEIILEDFPDEYAFFASEWTSKQPPPIIVLEKIH